MATAPDRRAGFHPAMLWAPLAIVVLALVLRVVEITYSPYGFFCDEASNGLDAYLIAHTLHDQHGSLLPAFFEALGPDDWRGGLHIYWEVPFMALFGLTEFAVRLGSAVAGTLTVLLTYFFVSKAVNRPVALLSAFLLATVPWHIMTSRIGFEWNSLPLVTALCLALFFLGIERPRLLPPAFIVGALGVYSYQAGRLFFPLLLLALVIIYAPVLYKHLVACAVGLAGAAIVLIPAVIAVRNGTFFAHYNQQVSGLAPSLGSRLASFWANYQAHFEPSFLFQTTDVITRHYVQGFGLLYPVEAPFLLIGLAALILRHRRADVLLLVWLLIYPAAASVASPPILSRSITGVIVLQIIAAQGLYLCLKALTWALTRLARLRPYRRALMAGLSAVVIVAGLGATANFMHAYLVDYPRYASDFWGWQWGAQQIIAYFEAHRGSYARELMNAEFNSPEVLMRFYTTPDTGQCASCAITNVSDPNDVRMDYRPFERELWAVSPGVLQTSDLRHQPYRVVGRLTYVNGTTAFLFLATGPGVRAA